MLSVLQPGNWRSSLSWSNHRTQLFVSLLLGRTVLFCLLSNVWKLLFHIFCPVFYFPWIEGKSSPRCSILSRNGSPWLISLWMPVLGIKHAQVQVISQSNKCDTSQTIQVYVRSYRMLLQIYTVLGLQHLIFIFCSLKHLFFGLVMAQSLWKSHKLGSFYVI